MAIDWTKHYGKNLPEGRDVAVFPLETGGEFRWLLPEGYVVVRQTGAYATISPIEFADGDHAYRLDQRNHYTWFAIGYEGPSTRPGSSGGFYARETVPSGPVSGLHPSPQDAWDDLKTLQNMIYEFARANPEGWYEMRYGDD